MPLTSAFVCVIETRMGTVSPGKAPCLGSSVVAVIVRVDEEVVLLRVSLVCGLRFAGGDSASTTWKLGVLVAVMLEWAVSSLGAGLSGGLQTELLLRVAVLF